MFDQIHPLAKLQGAIRLMFYSKLTSKIDKGCLFARRAQHKVKQKCKALKYIVQSAEAQFRCMSFSMSRNIYCCE